MEIEKDIDSLIDRNESEQIKEYEVKEIVNERRG